MLLRIAFALAFLSFAAPAFAGAPVTLKANPTDATGQVTLGEIFDAAGPAAGVVVAARSGPTVVLDAGAVQALARRYGLDWDNPRGITRIIVRGAAAGAGPGGERQVLAYARSLIAGEIVQAADLVWAPAAATPLDAPSSSDAVVGMAARRPLRAGDPVMAHDVAPPVVIKPGDTVAVTYADQGITLTLQGKAMGSAAIGDSVDVLNTASKKLIEAVASGPDQAVVGPEALQLKTQRTPAEIALR